jgi:hypothetical protein
MDGWMDGWTEKLNENDDNRVPWKPLSVNLLLQIEEVDVIITLSGTPVWCDGHIGMPALREYKSFQFPRLLCHKQC